MEQPQFLTEVEEPQKHNDTLKLPPQQHKKVQGLTENIVQFPDDNDSVSDGLYDESDLETSLSLMRSLTPFNLDDNLFKLLLNKTHLALQESSSESSGGGMLRVNTKPSNTAVGAGLCEHYDLLSKMIRSGQLQINLRATGALVHVFVSVMERINKELIAIANEKGPIGSSAVKKFICSVHRFQLLMTQIYPAFVAPPSDFCWQEESSENVKILQEIITVINLKNEKQYI